MHHDIELTKKGAAYVQRHNPTGCPEGVEPRLWRKAVSTRIERHLALATALLALIDGMDGDCDLEDNADGEASLGWAIAHEDHGQSSAALQAGDFWAALFECEADYVADDGFGVLRCLSSDDEDNLGCQALQLADGTIVNDREATECGNNVCDDNGVADSGGLADWGGFPLGPTGGREIAAALLGTALA
jgi:hypothetical protein